MKASTSTRPPRASRRLLLGLAALALAAVIPAGALSATAAKPAKPKPAPAQAHGAGTLTLTASKPQVTYGGATVLSGVLSTKQAGESVTIAVQRYGDASFATLASTTTITGGAWSYTTKPTIGSSYRAQWKTAASPAFAVAVRPLGTFHVLAGHRFTTRVVAARSFAGKFVQLQRRSSLGVWTTLQRMRLNASSTSTFTRRLPSGTSTLRIAMSVNQAGPGYLAAISRTILSHR